MAFCAFGKGGRPSGSRCLAGTSGRELPASEIMVPFEQKGVCTVKSIAKEGDYSIEDTIAVLTDGEGNDIRVNMIQKWPVKRAMTNYKENRVLSNCWKPVCA